MQNFYTVRLGDTLYSIARRWFIPLNSLVNANNLRAPYTIFPRQQLSMPPGVTTYVVKPGDTLFSISQRYGIPVNRIAEANGIDPPYVIVPGRILTVPEGVPYYIVRPGDSLYKIALIYNVTVNGNPRPDLIQRANNGISTDIFPGIRLAIPYPPTGGQGLLGTVLFDGFNNFIGIYNPTTGNLDTISIDEAGRNSNIFWSPDQSHIAYTGDSGIISIIDVSTKRITKIDQTFLPAFVDWSRDSRKVAYSNGRVIRIYKVPRGTFRTINRQGASYVQWFPSGMELLYEAKDSSGISQLFRSNEDGSNERQITNNRDFPLNNVRLSQNGDFVLYTTPGVSISEIYTIELSSGKVYKIPGGPEAKNYYPAWSPDSSMIAYSSTQFIGGKYYSHIRLSGARGEGDTTLAISSCYATPVTWSKDSRKIAYLSGCRDENPPVEVWSIDIRKPFPKNALSGFFFYNLDW